MVKRNAPPSRELAYGVSCPGRRVQPDGGLRFVLAEAHRWPGLPVTGEFVSASPFAETLQLNVLSDDVFAEQGKEMIVPSSPNLGRIHAEIKRVPGLVDAIRLPARPEDVQGVPASVHVAITVSRLAEKLGFGEQGSARVLLHRSRTDDPVNRVFRFRRGRSDGRGRRAKGPPNPLAGLTAYLLSYWKFLDAGRAESTVAPLERLVLLWP